MKNKISSRVSVKFASCFAQDMTGQKGQVKVVERWNIKKQRLVADALIYELTGKKIRHLKTGRPFIDTSVDMSLSHKDDCVAVAIVPSPYKIGIDVEHLRTDLHAELFFGPAITSCELPFLKTFCKKNILSHSSGVAVFWSIKESFFKCLDYNFKPAKISVRSISKTGEIRFDFSDEIKILMKERGLEFFSAKILLKNEHIFSQTIMKRIQERF